MSENLINAPEMDAQNEEQVVEQPAQEEIIVKTSATEVLEEPAVNEVAAEESVMEEPVVLEITEEIPIAEEPLVGAAEKTPKKFVKQQIASDYESLDTFNWDNLEKKGSKYSATEKERYAELYTKSFKSIDENALIKGTIVSINTREIVINIGFKSDGVITASELRYNPNLKIGDELEV
jgi:small subunit ribosomal protein S1